MYPIQCRGCGKEGIPRGEVAMFKTSTNCIHISPGGQPKQLNRIRLLLSEIYLKATLFLCSATFASVCVIFAVDLFHFCSALKSAELDRTT